MDLNQAMDFIRWDEQRQASTVSSQRAEENMALSRAKYGLAERKFAFDYGKELRRMQEKEVEGAKGVLSSWIDSYHKASTMGEKDSVVETMRNYYHSLPEGIRPMLEPYVKNSPLSPMEEKRREFLKLYHPPEEPSVETWKNKDYRKIAQYEFGKADFVATEQQFTTGVKPERRSFIGLPDGTTAFRDDKGTISTFSAEEMKINDIAAKAGVTAPELLLNDGWVTSKTPSGSYVENGKRYDTYSRGNFLRGPFEGESPVVTKYIADVAVSSPTQLPTKTVALMEAIIGKDEKNLAAIELRDLISSGSEGQFAAARQLSAMNPGFNFSFHVTKPSLVRTLVNWIPFVGWIFDDPKDSIGIAAVEGEKTALPVPGKKAKIVYVDRLGKVKDQYGTVLADSPEEAMQRIREELK